LLIFELKLCYLKDSGATHEQLMAMAPWVKKPFCLSTMALLTRRMVSKRCWMFFTNQRASCSRAGLDEEQSDEALQGALIFAARVERLRSHLRLPSTMRLVFGKDWTPPTFDRKGWA